MPANNFENIVDLATNPKRLGRAIERERASKQGRQGWLGLTPRYNIQAEIAFGDVVEVEVHPRSRAYKIGNLRTGDLIKQLISVDGVGEVSIENFNSCKFLAGTSVGVHFVRSRAGPWMTTTFKLGPWPQTRTWEVRQRIAPGRRVMKKDRSRFFGEIQPFLREMIPAPRTYAHALSYLARLLFKHDRDENLGVWPSYTDSAKFLGITSRTVNDIALMLRHFGVLKIVELPNEKHNSILYEITWPQSNKSARQPPPVPAPPSSTVRRIRLGSLQIAKSHTTD